MWLLSALKIRTANLKRGRYYIAHWLHLIHPEGVGCWGYNGEPKWTRALTSGTSQEGQRITQ